jgi:hypothetical protein
MGNPITVGADRGQNGQRLLPGAVRVGLERLRPTPINGIDHDQGITAQAQGLPAKSGTAAQHGEPMIIDFPSIQGQRWPAKTGLILYDRACHALAEAKSVDEVKDIIDKTVAVQMYAKQAHNRSLLEDAMDIRLRAERRCGALLTEMKATNDLDSGMGGDRRSRSRPVTVKLSDLGINKRQSTSYQNLAAMADDAFEVYVVNRKRKASTGFGGSGSYERNTPPEILELVRKVFHGRIDCDPASNAAAQRNVRAKVYYTIDDDG